MGGVGGGPGGLGKRGVESAGRRGQEQEQERRFPRTQRNGEEKGGEAGEPLIAPQTNFKEQFAVEARYPARIRSSLPLQPTSDVLSVQGSRSIYSLKGLLTL